MCGLYHPALVFSRKNFDQQMGLYFLLYYVILWGKKNRKGCYLNRLKKNKALEFWDIDLCCHYFVTPAVFQCEFWPWTALPAMPIWTASCPGAGSTSGQPAHHNIQPSFPTCCAASLLPIPRVSCMLWFSFEEVHSREASLSH